MSYFSECDLRKEEEEEEEEEEEGDTWIDR